MTTEPVTAPDEQELPEDFTSAWASVLLDIHEKQKRDQPDATDDEPAAGGDAA